MRITIEGSDFSEVPDGVYELDAEKLENFLREGNVLHIEGPVKRQDPQPDQRKRVLKEALELLWETQVLAEQETNLPPREQSATPPGSFWIEALEAGSGIEDVNRHGWRKDV